MVGDPCPKCGKKDTHWLSTTNEWQYYCSDCDIRFSSTGEILKKESTTLTGKLHK